MTVANAEYQQISHKAIMLTQERMHFWGGEAVGQDFKFWWLYKTSFLSYTFPAFSKNGNYKKKKIHCYTAAIFLLAKNANVITIYESKTNDGTADKH